MVLMIISRGKGKTQFSRFCISVVIVNGGEAIQPKTIKMSLVQLTVYTRTSDQI